ncbi:lasso peptide biosynthesis B2 protein [Spirulina sp. CS-785/01]|uniref:lasso peptide biosynthesis B2 protein n=1 Tax=Spirulina sp. CS-785/01 TaxID=3021716 RepID=UPI00232D4A8F|nr:lasso peptide biosynthesis B2 protein [Spirulina sp. CS-785/01]MDB9313333.1 lasso peptide biosynthesis B2 protein [Spirulina sp. CS-785/01]
MKTALSFSGQDWGVLCLAWLGFGVVWVLLPRRGLKGTQGRLLGVYRRLWGVRFSSEGGAVQRTREMVQVAVGYWPGEVNCLARSLVLWALLHRQGIEADFRIGVRQQEQFTAHAWVEYQGIPLNDVPEVYKNFVAFDGSILKE